MTTCRFEENPLSTHQFIGAPPPRPRSSTVAACASALARLRQSILSTRFLKPACRPSQNNQSCDYEKIQN
ncbi:MAG: hypothetical protein LBS59_04405 [Puniceicoccales bacterium]|nr:hypothetical protein [Puniceicoccales bacterium]